jgi:hypothetical protein
MATPQRAELTNEVTTDTAVVAVDPATRIVTLRRDDDRTVRVSAARSAQLRADRQQPSGSALRPAMEI